MRDVTLSQAVTMCFLSGMFTSSHISTQPALMSNTKEGVGPGFILTRRRKHKLARLVSRDRKFACRTAS